MLAHRHPQHLDRAAVVVVLDQRAVEAEEEVVGEGAGLAAAGPVRLVQHGQALEPVQRLRGRGRRHQREGPQLAVFLHAAADLRTRVRADQLQEVAAGGAHRLQVDRVGAAHPVLALEPARGQSGLAAGRPARPGQARQHDLGHTAQAPGPVRQHRRADRVRALGIVGGDQEVVVLDRQDVELGPAGRMQPGGAAERQAEALPAGPVDDQRQADIALAAARLQQPRAHRVRQQRQPGADPGPAGEEAALGTGLERTPAGGQRDTVGRIIQRDQGKLQGRRCGGSGRTAKAHAPIVAVRDVTLPCAVHAAQRRISVLLPNRLSTRSTASAAVRLRTSQAGLSSTMSSEPSRPVSAIISMHSCASR